MALPILPPSKGAKTISLLLSVIAFLFFLS